MPVKLVYTTENTLSNPTLSRLVICPKPSIGPILSADTTVLISIEAILCKVHGRLCPAGALTLFANFLLVL